jgi:hypothetical protein
MPPFLRDWGALRLFGARYFMGYTPLAQANDIGLVPNALPHTVIEKEPALWQICEFSRPNLGEFSPTEVMTAGTADATNSSACALEFRLYTSGRRRHIAGHSSAASHALSARAMSVSHVTRRGEQPADRALELPQSKRTSVSTSPEKITPAPCPRGPVDDWREPCANRWSCQADVHLPDRRAVSAALSRREGLSTLGRCEGAAPRRRKRHSIDRVVEVCQTDAIPAAQSRSS